MNRERVTAAIRVRYQETDQMAVAWHGHYVTWFEMARTEWWREQGQSYRELELSGILLPVLGVQVRFHARAHFDDLLHVDVGLQSYQGVRLVFNYNVTRPVDEKCIAEGTTEHTFVDREFNVIRLQRRSPEVHQLLIVD